MDKSELKEYFWKYNNEDFSKLEKIVVVGDQLATDIFWGRLNNMVTIWVTQFYKKCPYFKNLSEELYDINNKYADQYLNEDSQIHTELGNL